MVAVTPDRRNDPSEWKPGGGKFKAAVEQQAGVSELVSSQ